MIPSTGDKYRNRIDSSGPGAIYWHVMSWLFSREISPLLFSFLIPVAGFKASQHDSCDTAFPLQSCSGRLFYWCFEHRRIPADMPKEARPYVFLPRRKEGEGLDGPARHITVSYEALEGLFHLPLKHAAREIGLSPTTSTTACRRVGLEKWPFRSKGRRFNLEVTIAQRNAQTERGDAAMVSTAASMLQTPDLHEAMRAAVVSSTSPFWHRSFPSMALDTRCYGEARHAGPAFQLKTFAPHDTQSCIDPFTGGRISIGVSLPMPEGLPTTRPCGGEQGGATPLETGVSRERSCVEAVMDYLDLGCPISEADVESVIANDG